MNMKKLFTTIAMLVMAGLSSTAMAAISASVSVAPSVATINQKVTASVLITNGSASAVQILALAITANYNGNPLSRLPCALDVYAPGPSVPVVSVPGNGSATVPLNAVFFSPSTGVTGAGSGKFYIGAYVQTSDGSVTAAYSAGQVSINPLPLPPSEQ
jgi:hypothetical protein